MKKYIKNKWAAIKKYFNNRDERKIARAAKVLVKEIEKKTKFTEKEEDSAVKSVQINWDYNHHPKTIIYLSTSPYGNYNKKIELGRKNPNNTIHM